MAPQVPPGEPGCRGPVGHGGPPTASSPSSSCNSLPIEKQFITPTVPPNEALRAEAAARVAAAARSLSDTEASLETAAGGRIPRILAEATDRRVRWQLQPPSSTKDRGAAAGAIPCGYRHGAAAGAAATTAAADGLTTGTTDAGNSSAGEEAHRVRVRCSRRQQQESEGSGSRKPGRHKQRRWLHQQLLVAALRRLILTAGDDPCDARIEMWGAPRQPSCWQLLQADPVARELYIKRKEGGWEGPPGAHSESSPEREDTDKLQQQQQQQEQQQQQQQLPDPLLQRKSHCLKIMKQQQQQMGRPSLRAASVDGLRHSELLRQAVSDSEHSGTDTESAPKAAAEAAAAAAAAAAALAATGVAGATSSAASALARELEVQRLLLQQMAGSELQLLPSVQRIKSLRAAFRPMKQITRDAAAFFCLSAAIENAIRQAYTSLAAVKGGLRQQLQQLLQQNAAEAAKATEQQRRRPILNSGSSSGGSPTGSSPMIGSSKGSSSSSSSSTSSSSTNSSRTSNTSSSLRCVRLNRDSELPKTEAMTKASLSADELHLLESVERLQQQAAAGGSAAGEKRDWLLLWRLTGFERKVAHGLVALAADLDSLSLSPLDLPPPNNGTPCAVRQQQQQQTSRRKLPAGAQQKVLIICRKPQADTVSLPPVSLAALLVGAVTAAI
ncbi:uncharacterized protein EMH_0020290 [Eimeria mitis]|uniref:Uncharacterized protein n=1 Tax=Eimeria mitis TaxID=44415 RepID=U6KJW6_9EIME|nr:uncharacterized protein EMH_0020290 [Eimeria mitis]CDJ36552.1 hypothetical protein, conserved [Eimeria mitis]